MDDVKVPGERQPDENLPPLVDDADEADDQPPDREDDE